VCVGLWMFVPNPVNRVPHNLMLHLPRTNDLRMSQLPPYTSFFLLPDIKGRLR